MNYSRCWLASAVHGCITAQALSSYQATAIQPSAMGRT